MKLKGNMVIELIDESTGEMERVEEANMVTNAVNDILGLNPMGIFYQVAGEYDNQMMWNKEMLPICPNMVGGILLYSEALAEDAENIYPSTNKLPVAYAGNDVNATANVARGSLNLTESKALDNGYATSPDYVERLCSIIERWGLVKYDVEASADEDEGRKYYRVRKSWTDADSQKGAFTVLDNAKKCADEKLGYVVFNWKGEQVYPQKAEPGTMTDEDCPFLVKVRIPDLNIRKGSGTNTAKTGKATGIGIFTIMEVRQGRGSEKGWGRLKSGAGWIALDFCERI